MVNPPCKDCGARKLGCHSSCKDYISWKEEKNRINQTRRTEVFDKYPPFYMGNFEYHRKLRKDRERIK